MTRPRIYGPRSVIRTTTYLLILKVGNANMRAERQIAMSSRLSCCRFDGHRD